MNIIENMILTKVILMWKKKDSLRLKTLKEVERKPQLMSQRLSLPNMEMMVELSKPLEETYKSLMLLEESKDKPPLTKAPPTTPPVKEESRLESTQLKLELPPNTPPLDKPLDIQAPPRLPLNRPPLMVEKEIT